MPVVLKNNKVISSNDVTSAGVFKTKVNRDSLVFAVDAGDIDSYPGSGSTWYDLSGNGYNGTLYNGAGYNSSNGGVMVFDGSNDYMQSNIGTTILDGDPNFTIEMFVKRTGSFSSSSFYGFGGAGQGYGIGGWTPLTDTIGIDLYDSTRLTTYVTYPLNTFVHVAWVKHNLTVDVDTMICYINGVASGLTNIRTTTTGPRFNTSTSGVGVAIGRLNGNADGYYAPVHVGYFRIYSRPLNGFEIFENFQATRARFGV